jgi:hypothetical protein
LSLLSQSQTADERTSVAVINQLRLSEGVDATEQEICTINLGLLVLSNH